jgi:hypothetical protein
MASAAAAALQAEGGTFVFFPNRYVHESWRGDLMAPPLWSLFADCPRTEGRVAAFVIERASLGALPPPPFDTPAQRLCLLPGPVILTLALRLGVCLNAPRLGKIIDGKMVSRFKRELGAETWEFALRRASLITMQTDPLAPDLASEAPLSERLERSGINLIALSLADLDNGLKARFKLKLPKIYASVIDRPQGEIQPVAACQIVRRVAREAEPEWSALLG